MILPQYRVATKWPIFRRIVSEPQRRLISILPRPQHEALQAARAREKTTDYMVQYHKRAGSEGTISQGVRSFGMSRSRYVGLVKTHLQHVVTATAINFVRVSNWLNGEPLAQTRKTAFVRLVMHPVPC